MATTYVYYIYSDPFRQNTHQASVRKDKNGLDGDVKELGKFKTKAQADDACKSTLQKPQQHARD